MTTHAHKAKPTRGARLTVIGKHVLTQATLRCPARATNGTRPDRNDDGVVTETLDHDVVVLARTRRIRPLAVGVLLQLRVGVTNVAPSEGVAVGVVDSTRLAVSRGERPLPHVIITQRVRADGARRVARERERAVPRALQASVAVVGGGPGGGVGRPGVTGGGNVPVDMPRDVGDGLYCIGSYFRLCASGARLLYRTRRPGGAQQSA